MKVHASLLALLAAVSSISASPTPAPDDPLNLDLCGLLGTDQDLTPQSSLQGKFKLQAQKHDFTGPIFYVGETATSVSQFALSNSDEAHTFTFQDKVLYGPGNKPVVLMTYYSSKLARFFLGFSNQAKFGKIPWSAKHACDPATKEVALLLEYQQDKAMNSKFNLSENKTC